jgi:hypothetical protein
MRAFFIFNNLKVNSFLLKDEPLPGFNLLTWDHESYIHGTLWDIGNDAGYTPIGISKVHGQIWLAEDLDRIQELEFFLGVKSGLTEPIVTECYINSNEFVGTINTVVHKLSKIETIYNIVPDGKWLIKRDKL